MTFRCHKCDGAIVVNHVSSGEVAECKNCKALNIVPANDGDIGFVVAIESKDKRNERLSDCEKQNLFNKLWTFAMALVSYGALIIYIMARAKSLEFTFPLKNVILSKSFGMIFGVFGILIVILGIGFIEFYLAYRLTGKFSFFDMSLFQKYRNAKQHFPLFIMLTMITISELTIFIFKIVLNH